MTRFINSTVQAIHDDMLALGCDESVTDDVCWALLRQPGKYQVIFLDRVEGEDITDIAKDLGMWRESVSRIIHNRLNCIASLLGSTEIR